MKRHAYSCLIFVILTILMIVLMCALSIALDGWVMDSVRLSDGTATAAERAMQLTATYGASVYAAQLTAIQRETQTTPATPVP